MVKVIEQREDRTEANAVMRPRGIGIRSASSRAAARAASTGVSEPATVSAASAMLGPCRCNQE